MFQYPKRQTRRRIAYWTMGMITGVLLRALISGVAGIADIPENASELLKVIVPSLALIVSVFIGEQGASDHSERKHGKGEFDD